MCEVSDNLNVSHVRTSCNQTGVYTACPTLRETHHDIMSQGRASRLPGYGFVTTHNIAVACEKMVFTACETPCIMNIIHWDYCK